MYLPNSMQCQMWQDFEPAVGSKKRHSDMTWYEGCISPRGIEIATLRLS